MNNKMTIAIALMAGLLGGQLTRFLSPTAAFAQNPTAFTKEIRAQGHWSHRPKTAADWSSAGILAPISPPPANTDSINNSGARMPRKNGSPLAVC